MQASDNRELPRQRVLQLFARGPELLTEALHCCPRRMWLFRSESSRWSIHDIILLLADTEAQIYVECRQFVAEPGSHVSMYDAVSGASALGYFHQGTKDALKLLARLRMASYKFLCCIPNSVWTHTVRDGRHGIISLETWLNFQARYIPRQIEQIQQTYADWNSRVRPRRQASQNTHRGIATSEQYLVGPVYKRK